MIREVISEKGAYAQSFKWNKGASQVRLCWKRNQISHVLLDCLFLGRLLLSLWCDYYSPKVETEPREFSATCPQMIRGWNGTQTEKEWNEIIGIQKWNGIQLLVSSPDSTMTEQDCALESSGKAACTPHHRKSLEALIWLLRMYPKVPSLKSLLSTGIDYSNLALSHP